MINHSPAPWRIEPIGYEPFHREIWDGNFQCVAKVHGCPEAIKPGPEQDQLNADARIIAAAPQMYELLREFAIHGIPAGYLKRVEDLLNNIEES